MDKKINTDINSLKLLYSSYKKLIIPILIIFISLFLFIEFIVPQILGLISQQQKIKLAYSKLNVMKTNLGLLANLNDSSLDNQLQIVSKALPSNKDFNGILNALSVASGKTGISLGNFSFQVGDLSKPLDSSQYLFLSLSLNISGDVSTVNNFLNALSNILPLSEVSSVDIGDKSSVINVVFYYKSLPPITYSDDLPLVSISKNDLNLIAKLSSFNNASATTTLPASSGSTFTSPF